MSQERDIPKSEKSFEIKRNISRGVLYLCGRQHWLTLFIFKFIKQKVAPPHIPRPSLTITHVLSLLKIFSQLSFSVLRSDLCCTRLRG